MMSGMIINLWFLLFLIKVTQSTGLLTCNKCNSSESLEKCQDVIQCRDKQSCFTTIHGRDEQATYTMGCTDNQNCGEIPEYDSVSKMNVLSYKKCYECCKSDGCNYDLCKHPKPSQCQDDKEIDCAKLNEMFDICKDIHDAKLVCPNFCNLCRLVDGNWGDWSQWSACDVTCDTGKHTRVRSCTNPAPAYQGLECVGEKTDSKPCQRSLCPVHGGWSKWSQWSDCPVTCGIGMQKRFRNCSNPYPLRYGDHCFGDSVDFRNCVKKLCEDGVWENWENWGLCDAFCDSGIRQRSRSCTNVVGSICKGNPNEVQSCNQQDCPTTCTAKLTYDASYINVALRKKVKLSTTYPSFIGANMVDGSLNTMAITLKQQAPFAIVDLEDIYTIYSVYVVNRRDCCANRLNNVVIQIGVEPDMLATVARHRSAIGADCTIRFENPSRGRYVKIMLEITEHLQITELEVYSKNDTSLI